jgi:hypothetical protein
LEETKLDQESSFNSPKNEKQIGPSIMTLNNSSFASPLRTLPSKIDIESKAEEDFNSIKKEL